MADDRHKDKHGSRPRIPTDLWELLKERVGEKQRTKTVVALVRHYLGQGPMPDRPWLSQKPAKPDKVT